MSQYLTMKAAALEVGTRCRDSPTWHDTVRRWCLNGLRGVYLKSVLRGGVRMTRADWIDEFFVALQTQKDAERAARRRARGQYAPGDPLAVDWSKEEERRKRVRDELVAMGALAP